MPVVAETIAELRSRLAAVRLAAASAEGRPTTVALAPTMGALHDGHLALVARARELADVVVVSIFVNPLQFGPSEDLERYPRDLDADLARLETLGVDVVFAPTVDEMYPSGVTETRVTAGQVGGLYEGASRAGHFDGVLTVVDKLLNIVGPDVVVFGQKDAQQLHLVRRMVADLDVPVVVEAVPIVRDADGLALSSRNRYLGAEQKRAALALSAALGAAAASAGRGLPVVLDAARAVLAAQPLVKLDYLAVIDPNTFLAVESDYRGQAIVLVAATVGGTRLIDNGIIQLN